ncbi:MgtC/SapB family protein [Acholeplasma hippikon]|uniref:Putative Mg(2+) transport ATPase n=1 Tax=Acholeplasma hippikon TaxID=264636 RepID=A0A449BIZ8_9MOLU|nr:MgtC/SapB family protein [Acholeplasma hippikon]VEU82412.1 putative Mg(2+) transport ATPase [Acholeplasma hippikon]
MINDPIGNLLGNWALDTNLYSILFRLVISIIFSAIVGWERSSKRHAAGIRTFMIVTLSSTLAMLLDIKLMREQEGGLWLISTASIIAIAIISTNTILYSSKNQIKGLTTSVSLWASGIIGLLIGAGNYTVVLIVGTVFVMLLSLVPPLEIYLKNRSNHFEFQLELIDAIYLKDFSTIIRELGLRIDGLESNPAYINSGLSVYSVSVSIVKEELKKFKTHVEIIEALRSLDYVHYIEEMK